LFHEFSRSAVDAVKCEYVLKQKNQKKAKSDTFTPAGMGFCIAPGRVQLRLSYQLFEAKIMPS